MKKNKRNWLTLIISAVAIVILIILNITENNTGMNSLGLVILLIGSITIPTIIDMIKTNK